MCGIAGIFRAGLEVPVEPSAIRAMAATLVHRGPDGEGVHVGPGYGLGHRRLAIVDIAQGAQPMSNHDGSMWVTYNGEIYDFSEMMDDLKAAGHIFKTRCDTEVLVHAWEEWGEDCLERIHGMFAFAIWDKVKRVLFCARDPFGVKPLYYHHAPSLFAFSSEVKALLRLGEIPRELNEVKVADHLQSFVEDMESR